MEPSKITPVTLSSPMSLDEMSLDSPDRAYEIQQVTSDLETLHLHNTVTFLDFRK